MATWKETVEEAKKQLWLAGPMVFVCVFQYSLQMISLMFVGHLDEVLLAGASLAASFVNVTGFSVLVCSHHLVLIVNFNMHNFYLLDQTENVVDSSQ